jgi:hypothetical protein
MTLESWKRWTHNRPVHYSCPRVDNGLEEDVAYGIDGDCPYLVGPDFEAHIMDCGARELARMSVLTMDLPLYVILDTQYML